MLSAQITHNRSTVVGARVVARMALTAAKVMLTSVARACPRGQRSLPFLGRLFHLLFMPRSLISIPYFSSYSSPHLITDTRSILYAPHLYLG